MKSHINLDFAENQKFIYRSHKISINTLMNQVRTKKKRKREKERKKKKKNNKTFKFTLSWQKKKMFFVFQKWFDRTLAWVHNEFYPFVSKDGYEYTKNKNPSKWFFFVVIEYLMMMMMS